MAPMGNTLADDGHVSQSMLDYYQARAKGGVGLIVTQFASVSPDAVMPYSLCIYDDKFIPGLKQLVDTIHEQGTGVFILSLIHI